MARRIAGVGLVTVSLRRSIMIRNSWKTSLESRIPRLVRRKLSPSRFQQAGVQKALDGLAEALPLGRLGADAVGKPQADEEPLFDRRHLPGSHARGARDVLRQASPHSASAAPVEGMRIGAEAEIGLELPIFQIVPRFQPGRAKFEIS